MSLEESNFTGFPFSLNLLTLFKLIEDNPFHVPKVPLELKEQWKKEKEHLEEVIRVTSSKKMGNTQALEEQLKDAKEAIVRYRIELDKYKAENEELEEECQQLRETITLLEADANDHRRQIDVLTSQQTPLHTTADLALTQQLTQVQELLSNKECQLKKLNSELRSLRSAPEISKKEAELNAEINSLKTTVSQLQSSLTLERSQNKALSKDKNVLMRENSDLKRQVKEVEGIIKQRNKSDSSVASIVGGESRLKELEHLLATRQAAIVSMQEQLEEMEDKYEKHLTELERKLVAVSEENKTLKERKIESASKDGSGCGQSAAGNSKKCYSSSSRCAPSSSSNCSNANAKEDAHLLATIRGMKLELSSKEKEMMKLSRELEDAKKTNKRLQREREKQLKTASPVKPSSEISLKSDKSTNANVELADSALGRGYNPNLYQEEIEAAALIKMENKSLREEIRRLGKDILTLNNKRIQDLLSLQSEHEQEIQRLINDYTNRHSQTAIADLQGQIYTQQMVINHLKEQLKQLTLLQEENAMLKLERDHLEKALMGANKRVQELATPEACQYRNLLEKFENLERRHEVREQKLQSIVRDLLANNNSDPVPCGTVCRNKLLDKNREICYYRVEMDKILEALREFKRSK